MLRKYKGEEFHSQIEPANFNILSNENYHRKMLFTPIHKIKEEGQREHLDQTITSLFGVSKDTLSSSGKHKDLSLFVAECDIVE